MKKYLEIYQKTQKNHGNIMEFCQSGKVGTLISILAFPLHCKPSSVIDVNILCRNSSVDRPNILMMFY